jgi:hypothetical protein
MTDEFVHRLKHRVIELIAASFDRRIIERIVGVIASDDGAFRVHLSPSMSRADELQARTDAFADPRRVASNGKTPKRR